MDWPKKGTFCGNMGNSPRSQHGLKQLEPNKAAMIRIKATDAAIHVRESGRILSACSIDSRPTCTAIIKLRFHDRRLVPAGQMRVSHVHALFKQR